MICKICQKKLSPPECYWESYDCCSACIRKAAIENRKEELAESETIKIDLED